jgi:hypothetical protein
MKNQSPYCGVGVAESSPCRNKHARYPLIKQTGIMKAQ